MFLGADVEGLEKVAKTCRDAAEFAQTVRNVLRAIVAAASIFGPWGKAFIAYLERVVIPWLDRVIAALQAFAKVLSGNAEAQRKVSAGESFHFAALPAYRTPALPSGDTHQYPVLPPGPGGPAILPAPAPRDGGAPGTPEPGAPPVLDPAPVTLPDEAVPAGSGGDAAEATPGTIGRALNGGGVPSGNPGGGLSGGYGGSSGMDGGGSGTGGTGELADPLGLLDPAATGAPGVTAAPELGTGTGMDTDGAGVNPVMVGGAGVAAGAGAGLLGASLLRRGSGRSSLDAGDVPLEPLRDGSSEGPSATPRGFSTGPQVLGAGGDAATGRSGAPPWAGIGYGGGVPWETTGLSQHGRTSLAFGVDAGTPAVAGDVSGDRLALPQQCAQANSCLGVVWPAR